MIHIRGTSVLGTLRYIRETYGAEAHTRVVDSLAPRHQATFLGQIREGSWEPLEDLVAYMEAARALLAPGDTGFYRRMGAFVGRVVGSSGFRFLLGSDPHTAVPRAAFMWSFLYDTGSVRIVSKEARQIVFQIVEFLPPGRAQCERIAGFIEGCLEVLGTAGAQVEETTCVLEGAPHCTVRVSWP